MINNLYYGSDDADIDCFRNASFTFDTDVLATFLRRIYNGFDTSNDVEPTMWREILRIINEATVDGLVQGNYDTNIDKTFLKKLAHSNEVFSAFKVHDMGVDMAKKLVGDNGKIKPFSEWKKDIKSIASHYCGSWLQTEYNTATLRAKFAAEWKQYEADTDIFPNLRWMPTTSANPEEEHKVYWMNRLTLPVNDPFWNKHHPGDHWNCKCSLEQTDEPANPDVLNHIPDVKAQKGLAANPGKTGEMFDRSHPYYEQKCSKCWIKKNKSFKNALTPSGNCNNCPLADNCTEKIRMEHDKLLEERCAEFKKYKNDKDYIDKETKYNPKTGGLMATHKDHIVHTEKEELFFGDMTTTMLEKECQKELYRLGHKAILEKELENDINGNRLTSLDLTFDNERVDIASITQNGYYGWQMYNKNKQVERWNARPDVSTNAESFILYFHDPTMFSEEKMQQSIPFFHDKLTENGREQHIKRVHCVIKGSNEIKTYSL